MFWPSTLVSMAALDEWEIDEGREAGGAPRRPFQELSREQLENVLDMLERPPLPPPSASPSSGRGSSGIGPRERCRGRAGGPVSWAIAQRRDDPGPRSLRGSTSPTAAGWGELDEEMVYEARPRSDVSCSERATVADRGDHPRPRDRHPRPPELPAPSPFWAGRRDRAARPSSAKAIGAFPPAEAVNAGPPRRSPKENDPRQAGRREPSSNYLTEQQAATPGRPLGRVDRRRALP